MVLFAITYLIRNLTLVNAKVIKKGFILLFFGILFNRLDANIDGLVGCFCPG